MNLNHILKSTTNFADFKNHPQLEQAWLTAKNGTHKEKQITPYDVLKNIEPIPHLKLGKLNLVKIKNGVAYAELKNDIFVAFPTDATDGTYDIEYELKAKNINFKTPHAENMPTMPIPVTPYSVTTDFAWLAPAMSTEETRYYLNGVYIDNNRAVATDGHRMHIAKTESPIKVIIPRQLITLALKHKVETINISEEYASFTINGFTFYAKNVEGTYPDYARIIPQYNNKTITIKNKIPKLKGFIAINEEGNTFTYVYKDKEKSILHGEYFDPAVALDGEYFSVYGDYVTFKYEDSKHPITIEQGSNLAILMPVNPNY